MNKTSTPKKIIEPITTEMNDDINDKNDFPFEPGKDVINNIINFSKALSIRKSKNIEHIQVVLN